mgnify:FL=1
MNDDRKVSMLLDIDNFYGEHEGRLGPTLKFLLIGGAPLLLWVYTGFLIPAFLFFPPVGSVAGESRPHYPGAEKDRLVQFRKQINDDYASIYELLHIKTIHPDGCIEYVNGMVAYAVIAVNGTTYDPTSRAQQIHDFMSLFGNDYDVDVYVQNITDMKSLEERYNNVKLFVDSDAAKDFIDIIDHNRKVVYSQSRLTRIAFVVKGRKSYWTDIRDNCKMAIYSGPAKAFKEVKIGLRDDIQEVLNTDIRGVVDLDSLLQKKYSTHQYFGSKVLYFDEKPEEDEGQVVSEERGFMVSDG